MARPVVAFDCDDVLVNLQSPFSRKLHAAAQIYLCRGKLRERVSPDPLCRHVVSGSVDSAGCRPGRPRRPHCGGWSEHWSERFGLTLPESVCHVLGRRFLDAAELEPDAPDVFDRLRRHGFDIEVWTARGWHPDALALTARQLAPLGVRKRDIRIFGLHESKAAAACDMGVAALVDDNPRHIQALSGTSFTGQALLMHRPWNASFNLRRCHSLGDVMRCLTGRSDGPLVISSI